MKKKEWKLKLDGVELKELLEIKWIELVDSNDVDERG